MRLPLRKTVQSSGVWYGMVPACLSHTNNHAHPCHSSNRALVLTRLKRYQDAVNDCDDALSRWGAAQEAAGEDSSKPSGIAKKVTLRSTWRVGRALHDSACLCVCFWT